MASLSALAVSELNNGDPRLFLNGESIGFTGISEPTFSEISRFLSAQRRTGNYNAYISYGVGEAAHEPEHLKRLVFVTGSDAARFLADNEVRFDGSEQYRTQRQRS
jgi:hypothetical protein